MLFPPTSIHRPYGPLPETYTRADKSIVDDPPPYYTSKRCRLCQFSLRGGEMVVTQTGPERFSPEFAFRLEDDTDDILPASRGVVRFFHSSCLKFKRFIITDDLLAVTEHSIGLSELEERQRLKRIQQLLAPKISELLGAKLPFEVVAMIASYLVRESAMITAKNQSMFSQASDIKVDLSKDVYASYSVVDGVRYIKSLRNLDTNGDEEYRLVLDAKKNKPVYSIRICEDHLGIRFVQFFPSNNVPIVKGWWRDIPPSDFSVFYRATISAIRVESDGVKVRRITDTFDDEAKYLHPHVRWPTPEYPSKGVDLLQFSYIMEDFLITRNIRMSYFDCNAPGVTGYTMVCQGHWLSTIHAHGIGDDTEFYQEVDACFNGQVVIYMPLDQGEYVTEIKRRWMSRHISWNFFGLAFETNRERHAIFGSDEKGPTQETIMKPSQQGTRIYFNKIGPENEPSVRWLVSDKEFKEPFLRLNLFRTPRTPTKPPVYPVPNPWFASQCNLEGVKEVTLCRDVRQSHRPVIGMLMEYADGHRERLGQFRFDRALEKIQADQSGGLHISLQTMEELVLEDEDSTYVADVYGFPLGDPSICPENESWIEVSWSGTLEWKFKWTETAVKHIPAEE